MGIVVETAQKGVVCTEKAITYNMCQGYIAQ